MNDTLITAVPTTTLTTVPAFPGSGAATPPLGSKIRAVRIEPSSALMEAYAGQVGTIVQHGVGGQLQAEFDREYAGTRTWWVAEWVAVPEPGQRVTVTAVLEGASQDFREHIVGREVTFHEHVWRGDRVVLRVSDHGYPQCPDVVEVTALAWMPGDLTSSEPTVGDALVEITTEQTIATREAKARTTYDTLVEAINDLAVDQEWCSEFEAWAERNGVPVTRCQEKEYSIDLTLTYTVSVDDTKVLEAFHDQFGGEFNDTERADPVDAEVTASVTIYVTSSTEPDEMDTWEIEERLRSDDYTGWDDWTIDTWSEQ